MKSENRLIKIFPGAKDEFIEELNPGIEINKITKSSSIPIFWKCTKCSKPSQSSPNNRFRGNNYKPFLCPTCSRKRQDQKRRVTAAKKSGSIYDVSEKIREEWDWEKNGDLNPRKISKNSMDKFYWICSTCSKSFQASAYHRCIDGTGCKECSQAAMGKRYQLTAARKNFFGKSHPHLLEEWDYEKNEEPPENYSKSSNLKVHWVCKFGHSFEQSINDRTGEKQLNCPTCNISGTSKNELRLYCELKNLYQSTKWHYSDFGFEIDIFIPEINIGIEYDGFFWHKGKESFDKKKSKIINEKGITLIRLREEGLSVVNENFIEVPKNRHLSFEIFKKLLLKINNCLEKNNEKVIHKITSIKSFSSNSEFNLLVSRLPSPPEEESFLNLNPDKASFWDYQKNFPLTPDLFPPRSTFVAHWLCKGCNLSFTKTIDRMSSSVYGCNKCAKKGWANKRHTNKQKSIKAFDVRPELKNFLNDNDLEKIKKNSPGSHIKISLKCKKCNGERKNVPIKDVLIRIYLCKKCGIK